MKFFTKISCCIIMTTSLLHPMENQPEPCNSLNNSLWKPQGNYLKCENNTYLTYLPEHITTALQNNDVELKQFILAINHLSKKNTKK